MSINNISYKLKHKAFLMDLLWYFLVIVTLPITIPLSLWAIRQDDKEDLSKGDKLSNIDKHISIENIDAMFPIGYILPFQGTYPKFGKWEIVNIPDSYGTNVYIKRVG